MALPDQALEVIDPLLAGGNEEEAESSSKNQRKPDIKGTKMKECLISSILRVGIACSVKSPKDRMDIVRAAIELHSSRDEILGERIRA
ncbi:putative serine-threonine protein kinase, plant-type [Corchorus olitorius]|uniref:Serine-threonine protein kinase, plant-type n=1 Tax=Corchorus olitorius TaxID=93759 RepID=A0A1R3I2C0_9ROSI|nr:putative serine-threonine protein kinase, plant-type [Corchorus olitorius]